MLQELAKYAIKNNLAGLPGFKTKTARWTIVLGMDGEFLSILEEKRQFSQAPDLQQGELIAGGVTRSHFLLDTIGVVTRYGIDSEKIKEEERLKLKEKHRFFIKLLNDAASYEPSLKIIADTLSDDNQISIINESLKAEKAKINDLVTFKVGQEYPIEKNTWHDWWHQFRKSLKTKDNTDKQKMVCLLSGELTQPFPTHYKITGLSKVGGQPSGSVLMGFDKDSFTSYGLEQSANAACSENSASLYRSALEDLIAKAPPPIAGTMFLNWFKEPVPAEDNILDLTLLSNTEAEEANAREKADKLLNAINEGQRPDLMNNRYYILQLSAAGGRIMVRDWLEGDFKQLVLSIRKWFSDLELIAPNGKGIAPDIKLFAVKMRLVSFRKNESIDKTSERINKELAPVMPRIWRSILCDLPLPDFVAGKALHYIRSKMNNSEEDTIDNLDRVSCALLKAWLMRNKSCEGGLYMSAFLSEDHPHPAYQAGRLMAVLAEIQSSALGDVGAGVVQRYFAAASATPALVLGRLVRGAQYHLNKLDRGLAVWYEKIISEIMSKIGSNLPSTLTLEGQTLFALGYYQQKANMFNKEKTN